MTLNIRERIALCLSISENNTLRGVFYCMNLISSQFILQNRGIIKENAVNKTAVRLSDFIISNNSKKISPRRQLFGVRRDQYGRDEYE